MSTAEDLEQQAREWLGLPTGNSSAEGAAPDPIDVDSLGLSAEQRLALSEIAAELPNLSTSGLRERQQEYIASGNGAASLLCQQLIAGRQAQHTGAQGPAAAKPTNEEADHYRAQIDSYRELLRFEPEGSDNHTLYTNLIENFEKLLGSSHAA